MVDFRLAFTKTCYGHMLQHPRVYGYTWGKPAMDEWSGDDAKMLTTLSDPQVVQVSSVEDGWNVS